MPPDTLAGDLGGGLPAQFRVRSLPVVVLNPGSDLDPCVGKAHEQGLVQQFVAHAAVEAFDEAVLHRLAGGDVMPFDPTLLRPTQDGRRGQLGTVAHWEAPFREPLWP